MQQAAAAPAVDRLRAASQTVAGRPVRVLAVGVHQPKTLPEIAAIADNNARSGADVIVLPETFMGQRDNTAERLDGPTVRAFSEIAKRHGTYVVCPIDRTDGEKRYNSAVLLDRNGKVAFIYDKVYPIADEYEAKKVAPGSGAAVVETDFGRAGFGICFDANFPEFWERLSRERAEVVFFPSAYYPGARIQAHALNYGYYIVVVTGGKHTLVYDITGSEMLYDHSDDVTVSRFTIDLDRTMFHTDFNNARKARLLAEHGEDLAVEGPRDREKWYFVLRARRAGVSARALARKYGLEEYGAYIERSRREADARRGHSLAGGK